MSDKPIGEPAERSGFEVSSVHPGPDPEERAAILEALEEYLARDRPGPAGVPGGGTGLSAWRLAGRLAGRRGGILDARASLGRAAWPASDRLPWAGRPHQGRVGRGDSR